MRTKNLRRIGKLVGLIGQTIFFGVIVCVTDETDILSSSYEELRG